MSMTTDSPTGEPLEEWDGTAGTAVAYIRTLEADRARLRAEVERLEHVNRNHRETLRSIRALIEQGDMDRVHLWVSDALSGYTEPIEETLVGFSDRAHAAEARAARYEEALKELRILDEAEAPEHGGDAMNRVSRIISRALTEGGEHE